ncbi:MAG: hypothetical protein HY287_01480 [Planctomycetes bacterium]|nr:hypothetical protein [Planctomycetota bacterium]MBI3832979.1 hypothetical protein [Planctomycetota bacterium]
MRIRLLAVAALLVIQSQNTMHAASGAPGQTYLYWIADDGAVRRANVDQPSVESVWSPGGNRPQLAKSIAIDNECRVAFWTDSDPEALAWLIRANIDATNLQHLGSPYPAGMALDNLREHIYVNNGQIFRTNLDGSDVHTVISSNSFVEPSGLQGIAIDVSLNKLYWLRLVCHSDGNNCDDTLLERSDLDGNNIETVLDLGNAQGGDVEVDQSTHKIYCSEYQTGAVLTANGDGSQVQLLFATTSTFFTRLAVDSANQMLYWHNVDGATHFKILRGSLDGTSSETVISGLQSKPWAFAIQQNKPLQPHPASANSCFDGTVAIATGCSSASDCASGTTCGLLPRYLAFKTIAAVPCYSGGVTIRVEIVAMPQAPARVGDVWWAGTIQTFPFLGSNQAAKLDCEPIPSSSSFSPTTQDLRLYGAIVVPGAAYEIRICDATGDNCSYPILAETAKDGDVVAPFGGSDQPNISDIAATVDAFRFVGIGNFLSVTHTDLVGNMSGDPGVPDQKVDIMDVAATVNGFRGIAFPYPIPSCP